MTTSSLSFPKKKIISLKEAREQGLKRYFTGKPCGKGHVSERNMERKCLECISIKNKKYRESNPDKVKQNNAIFRNSSPSYFKEWVSRNSDKFPIYRAKWEEENADIRRERKRIHSHTRRSLIGGTSLSVGLSVYLLKMQRGRCACCKKKLSKTFRLDHIYPISKGGVNEDWNIQILCPSCNLSKNSKHPIDFMQQRGFLI